MILTRDITESEDSLLTLSLRRRDAVTYDVELTAAADSVFLACSESEYPLKRRLEVAPRLLSVTGRDEQRRGGLHRPEAGVRPVLQPLVRGEVPEGGPERRPVHRELPDVPALRTEGHQGERHPGRRSGVHGPQQGQARELMHTPEH